MAQAAITVSSGQEPINLRTTTRSFITARLFDDLARRGRRGLLCQLGIDGVVEDIVVGNAVGTHQVEARGALRKT
jgi:hypothetical protein